MSVEEHTGWRSIHLPICSAAFVQLLETTQAEEQRGVALLQCRPWISLLSLLHDGHGLKVVRSFYRVLFTVAK